MDFAPPVIIKDAEIVLHLEIDVPQKNRQRFLEFCGRAFPVYESIGNAKMTLYEDTVKPGRFNEVGYYRTLEDYKRGEHAIRNDPAQARLIEEWRTLLNGQPKVTVYRRVNEPKPAP